MRKSTFLKALYVVLTTLLLAGCYFGFEPAPPDATRSRIETAAAQTVSALRTSVATVRTETPMGGPTITNTPRGELYTLTPGPSVTQSPTTSGSPCNQAAFVDDVTIPDGSIILPLSRFTKTWRLRNTGTCTWTSSYQIVFSGRGSNLGSQSVFPLIPSGEVNSGQEALVSVDLVAPGQAGSYRSYWQLRAPDGSTFGIDNSNVVGDIYADFRVDEQYSFAEHVCSAQWSNGKKDLPCRGSEGGSDGYVLPLENNLVLEDNQTREGPGMYVMAEPISGGFIVGRYPAVIVPAGADFRATVSCRPGVTGCYIRFRVAYSLDGGPEQTLGEWMEGHEGGVNQAIADLDQLAGRSAAFSLYVYVTGAPDQSKGVWFNPRIVK